ncbi:hypothetical protein OG618_18170 [Kitasatospora sp. NBC_01246]|uniref:hypothetical protein n=1 Tax=Kitasatospora sp. NBC_01246 TaxID=2903570 RepID=UPI002E3448FA|nr:hypothetical protein [Kitasatospora sp. NBC_01246]
MSANHIPAPPPELAQTRVVDVFPLHGFTCAHTSNDDGTAHWWHLFTTAGRSIGATNHPELIGSLLQQNR